MGLVFIWLFPYMTGTILEFNISLTLYILIGVFFEERKLRREFGQEYVAYAAKTPMLIPFIKKSKT
jgi:protein-S-isoprenylcysteine O-methyltransferase Ste14